MLTDNVQLPTPIPTTGSAAPYSSGEAPASGDVAALENRVTELRYQAQSLRKEIDSLQANRNQLFQTQIADLRATLTHLTQDSTSELERRKQALQIAVEQLERRQERIREEMRSTFAGASQELAVRVQGFKDYLAGSLQDLAATAEQLELVPQPIEPMGDLAQETAEDDLPVPHFTQSSFQIQTQRIQQLIEQYRSQPDYYGPVWQLRRTFESIHADALSKWFLSQGGRGAIKSMGGRAQNILLAAAATAIIHDLFGDRLRTLVLADSPEALGEWRRGLQENLGIARTDFGPDRGITLFGDSQALAQRADRILAAGGMPLILVDEAEDVISLAILQFPLWLAFAPNHQSGILL